MPALEAVLSELEEKNVNKILCAGDLVGYYTRPKKVVEEIRDRGIPAVKGNHDEGVSGGSFRFNPKARKALKYSREKLSKENRKFLEELPERKRFERGGLDVFVAHGSPRRPLSEYLMPRDADESHRDFFNDNPDVVVLGHTHMAFNREVNGTLFMNPGSVGKPRDGDPRPSYAVLDTESRSVQHFRTLYDWKSFSEEVREKLGDELAEEVVDGR
jgi:putative phosphoesterase